MQFELMFRAKGQVDGCGTLNEMALALEQAAAWLRQAHVDGITLATRVEDDYAFLTSTDSLVASRYGMRESVAQPGEEGQSSAPRLSVVKTPPPSPSKPDSTDS